MNEEPKSPHYIAIFTDNEFKKGLKQLNTDEIDKRLEAIVRLFCCLHGRDQFIASFTNLLASRLLNKTSVSNEAEISMIKKLQVECGHNTVSKIRTMFEDGVKSEQVQKDYKNHIKNTAKSTSVEFSVEILTSGHWPYQDMPKCIIPPQLKVVQNDFQQFYKQKFSNRQINFLYSHGLVQIQTAFLPKAYQMIFSCYQASIIMLFNQKESMTYREVQDQTGLSDQDLKSSMMKLCHPKLGIIIKANPKKPVFLPDEKLVINEKYANNSIRVNFIPVVTSIQLVEGAGQSGKSINELDLEVAKERSMVIDAVIVRIMKARKVETNQVLIEEVIRQIKLFKAQPPIIKKRIESLIERDYLERMKNEKGKYQYKP